MKDKKERKGKAIEPHRYQVIDSEKKLGIGGWEEKWEIMTQTFIPGIKKKKKQGPVVAEKMEAWGRQCLRVVGLCMGFLSQKVSGD